MPPFNIANINPTFADSSTSNTNMSSTHYSVPAPALARPSRKPKHLQLRFSQRPKEHSISAANAARQEFLEKRRVSLRNHNNHIKTIKTTRQLSQLALQSKKRAHLTSVIQNAAKNRQQILKHQQQHAADTVANAKSVANRQHKLFRLQQEELKNRLDEQLRLSEERRLERLGMRSVPRSKLLEITQDSILDEAVVIIQRQWRTFKLAKLVERFTKLHLTIESARNRKFDELTELFQKAETLEIVRDLLERVYMSVVRSDGYESLKKNHPRLFLSAFLMVSHQKELMDDETVCEKALVALKDFEYWLGNYAATDAHKLLKKFLESWSAFVRAFNTWKTKDTEKLIDGMVAHWLEVERLWLSVMHQVNAETDWRPRIEQQQRQIISRLSKFGKTAMTRLHAEQRKLRMELARRSTRDEDSDAVMASSDDSDYTTDTDQHETILSTSPQMFPTVNNIRRDSVTISRNTSLSPQRSSGSPIRSPAVTAAAVGTTSGGTMAGVNAATRLKTSVSTEFASLLTAYAADSTTNSAQMTNEQMAHELVMDPDFELAPKKPSQLEERVREMAKKAFFDSIRDGFLKGEHQEYLPPLLEDIKKQLLSIVNEGGKIAQEINEVLDLDLLRQQLSHVRTIDIQPCLLYIVNKMGQLCAPIRDAGIRELLTRINSNPVSLSNPTELMADHFITTLELIFEQLESMRLDLANYRLRSLRPILSAQSVEYESKKFQEQLDAGTKSLEVTRQWLANAAENLAQIARQRNPEGIAIHENKVRFEDVYNDALLSLLFSPVALSSTQQEGVTIIPETLHLDEARLKKYQNEAQAITIVAALVMLARNTIPKVRGDKLIATELKKKAWILLQDDDVRVENLTGQVISVVNDALKRVERSHKDWVISEDEEHLIRSMVEKTMNPKNSVFGLVARRLQMVLKQFLLAEEKVASGIQNGPPKDIITRAGDANAVAKVELVSPAMYASAGLDMVRDEVEGLGKRVVLLSRHNKRVHASRYDTILNEVLR